VTLLKNKFLFWFGLIWASPFNAIALLLAVLCVTFGARILVAQFDDRYLKAVIIHGGTCRVLLRILVPWLKADGITIGHIIFLNSDNQTQPAQWLIAHELTHTQQWAIWGPLFPLVYSLASVIATSQSGHYYRDNIFEKQARRGETAFITTQVIR
jgi:hypothetical protein